MTDDLQHFLDFSVDVTCFTRFELLGTGQAQAYYDTARSAVGPALDELLGAYAGLGQGDMDHDTAMRRRIFGDEKLGPVARAIIKLWYIGIWYELPRSWTEAYGAVPQNKSFMVSPSAYAEGLLWTAIGAHPPGAKAPGYASWKDKPNIPAFAYATRPSTLPDTAPKVTQTEPGHISPHHATTPQHPPPSAQGPS